MFETKQTFSKLFCFRLVVTLVYLKLLNLHSTDISTTLASTNFFLMEPRRALMNATPHMRYLTADLLLKAFALHLHHVCMIWALT